MSAVLPPNIPGYGGTSGSGGTTVTYIPGPAGPAGADGADGTDGVSAYTTLLAGYTQPAVSATVTVVVANSMWMAVGQLIFVETGGYYEISVIPSSVSVTLENLGYASNAAVGAAVGAGSKVVPGGVQGEAGTDITSQEVYFSDVDPNGVITAPRPAICYSSTGSFWIKTGAGTTNTGWTAIIEA